MCRSEQIETGACNKVADPYLLVIGHNSLGWFTVFFDGPNRDFEAHELAGKWFARGYKEVRVMSASMVSRWGPLDPGGAFNHDKKLVGRDGP